MENGRLVQLIAREAFAAHFLPCRRLYLKIYRLQSVETDVIRWPFLTACLVSTAMLHLAGCSESEPPIDPPGSDAISEKDYVEKVQSGQMTSGTARFLPGSVQPAGKGKYQFKDTAGGTFEVTVTTDADGGYKMSDPVPVK